MPIGKFIPFDEADYSPRFFARPIAFDCECPYCGRLLIVGTGRRDDEHYNHVTSEVTCPDNTHRRHKRGCGRKFLMGMVAWGMTSGSRKTGRPYDQRPNPRQLAELRQAARGLWAKRSKTRGASVNTIQEMPDAQTIPLDEDE